MDVARTETGALGIEVDASNVVATNSGQPGLMLGDEIVAVDGEALAGRPIGQVITKKDSYVFTVRRDMRAAAGALERVLLQISREAPVSGQALATFDDLKSGLGDKALSLVTALEETAATASVPDEAALCSHEGLLGFWRLRLTTDTTTATEGATGFGAAPLCLLHASFLLFQTAQEPSAQIVEVIGQQNLGQHAVAALKGEWGVQPSSDRGSNGADLVEQYSRLEFAGSAQIDAPPVAFTSALTYLGADLRIVRRTGLEPPGERSGEGAAEVAASHIYVYERQSPQVAQSEISRILDVPVPRPPPTSLDDLDDVPLWARRSGGGGGPAPEPMPEVMGP